LWAIERSYLDAWTTARPGAPPYRTFVEHWTIPEFGAYVDDLATAADAAIAGRPDDHLDRLFLDVVNPEADFWEMAWTA